MSLTIIVIYLLCSGAPPCFICSHFLFLLIKIDWIDYLCRAHIGHPICTADIHTHRCKRNAFCGGVSEMSHWGDTNTHTYTHTYIYLCIVYICLFIYLSTDRSIGYLACLTRYILYWNLTRDNKSNICLELCATKPISINFDRNQLVHSSI